MRAALFYSPTGPNIVSISVKSRGAVGDGVTDDYATIILARDYARSIGAELKFPPGIYKHSLPLDFGATRECVSFAPGVILYYSGGATNAGITLDAGASGQNYNGSFGWGCPPRIRADTATYGVYIRSWHHGRADFRVISAITAASKIDFAVCTEIKMSASVNEAAFIVTPVKGLIIDKRNAGEYTADCVFHNVIIEGVSGTGLSLVNCTGSQFIGGTSEANAKGCEIAAGCNENTFNNFWCEANATSDFEVNGSHNVFNGCHNQSNSSGNNVELITGEQNAFFGGYHRTVNNQVGSTNAVFNTIKTSDNGALGIKGVGTYSNIACFKTDVNGLITSKIPDAVGESGGVWTPAFASSGGGAQGAVTYNTGTYFRVGKLCFVQGIMSIAKGTLGVGAVSVTGLPFQARNTALDYQYIIGGEWGGVNLAAGNSFISLQIAPNASSGVLTQCGNATASGTIAVANFPDPMILRFSGVYETI